MHTWVATPGSERPCCGEVWSLPEQLVARGERDTAAIVRRMTELILAAGATIDYVALVDPDSLAAVGQISGPTLALLAVKIDGTRLIDNAVLELPYSSRSA